jgi:hypothetical protein
MKRVVQSARLLTHLSVLLGLLAPIGCHNTPFDLSDFSQGPTPLRDSGPTSGSANCCYEDSLQGHHIFDMYCGACHNARSLAERPFSNYQNIAQHMRVRANLTGQEYAKLMVFLRRWHDVPPPEQREAPAPTRFFFSQPNAELRQQQPKTGPDLQGGPKPGATSEVSPAQPVPGFSPQEAR